MKQIIQYIQEKLKITKDTKINSNEFSQDIQDQISDQLCIYFQASCQFGGNRYDNKLEIIDRYYNNSICKFFNKIDLWEDVYKYIFKDNSIEFEDFKQYIKDNEEQLYKNIKDFVL